MSGHPILKKPKTEPQETEQQLVHDEEEEEEEEEEILEEQIRKEQEEAMVALIEHRTKEVEHLRQRITYYTAQLDDAEKKLEDTQNKLARLRGQNITKLSKKLSNGRKEETSKNSIMISEGSQRQSQRQDDMKPSVDDLNVTNLYKNGGSSPNHTQSRPQIIIPSVAPNISQHMKTKDSARKYPSGSGSLPSSSTPASVITPAKPKGEKASKKTSELESGEMESKGKKRKHVTEQTEHKDLINLISKSSSPVTVRCQTGCLLTSQHKRKLRTLILCPTDDQLFATSALDGVVNLWQVQGRGSSASLLSSTDCQSDKRRWPEDIAWHPHGKKLFSVYSADNGDSQISILNLNKGKERTRVSFLEDRPHIKGIINSIGFMPWDDKLFATGGSDHGVILWTEKDEEDMWKPKSLHRNQHSSAVMGIAGMHQKNIVMSAGADKRIIGYDVVAGRADYKHQIESKCMSVLPNPCDFNLFMVQTGTPGRQLRLFDIRLRQIEIHSFGWMQETSESQSALVNQAWSPDGLYITSGSADPVIHIFDIRYNANKPSQSIRAHQKRVFKAAWHHALPLLISISSDLNIGLHRIT